MNEDIQKRINDIRNMATQDIHTVFISPKQRIMMLLDYLENGGDLKEMGTAIARRRGVKGGAKGSKVEVEDQESGKEAPSASKPEAGSDTTEKPHEQAITSASEVGEVPVEDEKAKNKGASSKKARGKKWF